MPNEEQQKKIQKNAQDVLNLCRNCLVINLRFHAWLTVETAPRAFHHEIMPCGVVRRSRGCSYPQIDAIPFPFGLEVVRTARSGGSAGSSARFMPSAR